MKNKLLLGISPLTILPIAMTSCQVVEQKENTLGIIVINKEDRSRFVFFQWSNIIKIESSNFVENGEIKERVRISTIDFSEYYHLDEWIIKEIRK